jgi:hypothetical protein
MTKIGDLVKVVFGRHKVDVVGIFIEDDLIATGLDEEGYPIITRAHVLWDGEIYSTPLEQLEIINESR